MIDPLYTWYKFDFNQVIRVTLNEERYIAALTSSNLILVWQQNRDTMAPVSNDGSLVSLINLPFPKLIQMQWVNGSNYLLIHTGEEIVIWDIYRNQPHLTREETRKVAYAKSLEIGIVLVFDKGSMVVLLPNRTRVLSNQSDLVVNTANGIIVYPVMYEVTEGQLSTHEMEEVLSSGRTSRAFEGRNELNILGNIYSLPRDWNPNDLTLPEGFHYLLNEAQNVVLQRIGNLIVIQSADVCVVCIENEGKLDAIQLTSKNILAFQVNSTHEYYVIRNEEDEYRLFIQSGRLVLEKLPVEFFDKIELEHMPLFFYFDLSQDLAFARFNFDQGFIWYPDHEGDYLFLDLLNREGSIFQNIKRNRYVYVQVAYDGKYLLEWHRGDAFPAGKLYYRNVLDPENGNLILYEVSTGSSKLSYEEYNQEQISKTQYPLIIPKWHKIDLYSYTDGKHYHQNISNSLYYLLIETWSKLKEAELLQYPEPPSELLSYVLYGTLELTINDGKRTFQGVSPCWIQTDDYFAFHHIDGRVYVHDLTQNFVPSIIDFPFYFPILMEITTNQHLIVLGVRLKATEINSHPQEKETLRVEYPHVVIYITNLKNGKQFRKSIRYPVKSELNALTTSYEEEEQLFSISFPSYTRPDALMSITFDFKQNKFSKINTSEQKRYWEGFTQSSPYSFYDKGEEFPVEPHPEIKREYTMRPFFILKNALVRKSDDLVISAADLLDPIEQMSTSDLFSLEGRISIDMPFYATQSMKPIYIQEEYSKLLDSPLFILNRLDEIPHLFRLTPNPQSNDLRFLQRVRKFLEIIRDSTEVHTNFGIAYRSPDVNEYQIELDKIIDSISRKIK